MSIQRKCAAVWSSGTARALGTAALLIEPADKVFVRRCSRCAVQLRSDCCALRNTLRRHIGLTITTVNIKLDVAIQYFPLRVQSYCCTVGGRKIADGCSVGIRLSAAVRLRVPTIESIALTG